ncbi:HAD family hydrolase [Terriglobus tenax]|uniref:HAD family hydrolase n=1 Tax=Terriglobus tenax TaxID=1111115 RepID=UPI0021DF71D1|nr:HAD family phosphatase [Terriglobus tenax]
MANTPLCAVLFDYGQVLSRTPDLEQWERMKQVLGLDEINFQEGYWQYRHAYDRGDLDAVPYWRQIASDNRIALTETSLQQLIDADVAMWAQLNQPMVQWLLRLREAGVKTGLLSNIGDAMAEGLRAKFEWMAGFDYAVYSHEHNLAKPEHAIYRIAAEGLGCAPEAILFLDDKAENIEAARAVGMRGIQYDLKDHAAFEQQMMAEGLDDLLAVGAVK